jgi:glycosyltransferase involved in cell wall biosynthesis
MQTLEKELQEEHEVRKWALSNEENYSFFDFKLPMEIKKLGGYLKGFNRYRQLRDFNPDLVLTQHELSFMSSFYCQRTDTEMFYFLRDYAMIYEERYWGRYHIDAAINYLTSFVNQKISGKILDKSNKIIANSNYIAEKYKKHYPIKTKTVYPFVDIENYKVDETGDKILHVNPAQNKGIELTLEVAEQLPEEEFIIAGTGAKKEVKQKINQLENVEHIGYLEDMKEAYRQTKIVLMPSKWEEPYGRIPIEAGASRIPTIATKKGGLPESVDNEDLLIEYSSNEAAEKIKQVKNNYTEFSEQARNNAEEKKKQVQINKLMEMLK